jgi:peptidyl-prolyl cis-trans isomerase A (cyclophilin A)
MGPDLNFPDPFTGCTKDPGPGTVTVTPADGGGDPTGGADKFTLDMALQGFPSGTGKLKAGILTEKGIIVCTFDEVKAPISVANFIGLARGTRPFLKGGVWQVGRFYDGLKWHRVIYDFVIQGGDPRGTGSGGPGYSLPVENHVPEPLGTLAMAASAEPSGSQFYIVVGTGPAPDYNVFGSCLTDVAQDVAAVDTNSAGRPDVDIHMLKVDIARCPM